MSGRTKARKARLKVEGRTYGLPPLPKLENPSDTRKRAIVWERPKPTGVPANAHGAGWGGYATGRWVGGGTVENVHGVCDKCGAVQRAWDLIDRDRPFGRGEERVCRGGCKTPAKQRRVTVKSESE